jgi:hypothetical protein
LSDRLAGGKNYLFGLFSEGNQIGFQAFSNYVPIREGTIPIFHFNRIVIHPDYAGLGLGIKFIDATSQIIKEKYGFRVLGKFSSIPVFRSMKKSPRWKLIKVESQIGTKTMKTSIFGRSRKPEGFRKNVKTFSFEFIG